MLLVQLYIAHWKSITALLAVWNKLPTKPTCRWWVSVTVVSSFSHQFIIIIIIIIIIITFTMHHSISVSLQTQHLPFPSFSLTFLDWWPFADLIDRFFFCFAVLCLIRVTDWADLIRFYMHIRSLHFAFLSLASWLIYAKPLRHPFRAFIEYICGCVLFQDVTVREIRGK